MAAAIFFDDREIGKYAIVARRKGKDWYVGGITNNNARSLYLSFDFL